MNSEDELNPSLTKTDLAYRALDDWFSRSSPSYQVHWTPREVIFRGAVQHDGAGSPEDLASMISQHGVDLVSEDVDGRRFVTARLNLAPPHRHRYFLHLGLFLLTFLMTVSCGSTAIGTPWEISRAGLLAFREWRSGQPGAACNAFLELLTSGLCFSVPFLTILTVHEFGHYFAARWHRMSTTLPFFIPIPVGIGTMGAMIALRSPLVHRRAVFDVGIAGPLAGFLVALPIFYYGIELSTVESLARHTGLLLEEGKSLLYVGLVWLLKGPIPSDHALFLHPIAWAGWFGLFITALNLVPVGQLDGGHIAYAMFGPGHAKLARVVFLFILFLIPVWGSYIVFAALLYFLVRLVHPPAIDETVGLNPWRYTLGWAMFAIFILTFVPIPLSVR
ncbi:MAG: site-2 protease family protein [Planctomycetes bacterium]|nr:site-2 protease family protein [Planctomycetota bacterium]